MADKIRVEWLTGEVDARDFPPAVTAQGIPALPGESSRDYWKRAKSLLEQAQTE